MFNFSVIVDMLQPKAVHVPAAYATQYNRVSTDTRSVGEGDVFVALKGERYDANLFLREAEKKRAGLIIASSLPDALPFSVPVMIVDDTLAAYARLAGYVRRRYQAFVLGITGSYGKTTTKELCAYLFSKNGATHASAANENNAVGVPKTLLGIGPETKYAVIEMGTNVIGEIAFEAESAYPDCQIVTGIADVHTETFLNRRGVLKEKLSVFKKAPYALAVLNHDDALLRNAKVGRDRIFFGTDASCDVHFKVVSKGHCHVTVKVNGKYELVLNTYAAFYAYNACAAIAAAKCAGISVPQAIRSLDGFCFPKMRTELIDKHGLKIFNDAYNSNPFALQQSLEEFKHVAATRKIAVVGDMLELGPLEEKHHRDAVKTLMQYPDDCLVVLVGPRFAQAQKAVRGADRLKSCADAERAADVVASYAAKGDAILLKGSRGMALEKVIARLGA